MMFWALMLLMAAFLGHTVLMVFTMNWLYGCPFPKRVTKVLRKVYAVLIAVGCAYLAWSLYDFGWNWSRLLAEGEPFVRVYSRICWLAGLVLFPLATGYNRLIRNPAVLLSNHSKTVNVVKELGFKPVGLGKRRRLAQLPFNQCFEVEFSERTLQLPQIPESWEGLRILHLSDLHFCGTPDRSFYHQVVRHCGNWDADIVAVTGDFVDTDRHHRWIVPVLGRLRWRIAAFAILGNHDAWRAPALLRRRLRRIGMRVLGDSSETIDVRGEPMVVVGHEGPWFSPPDMSQCPPEGFRLCLSHTPDNIIWAQKNRIGLVLAGHVHGGQICLPFFGSIFVPSRYSRRYDGGTFREGKTVMHVSRGLAGEVPLRYNCRPEVTLLVLQR
jgi:predicted MPP superfamily phosphohydrolase